jgi:hypothetical protein
LRFIFKFEIQEIAPEFFKNLHFGHWKRIQDLRIILLKANSFDLYKYFIVKLAFYRELRIQKFKNTRFSYTFLHVHQNQ